MIKIMNFGIRLHKIIVNFDNQLQGEKIKFRQMITEIFIIYVKIAEISREFCKSVAENILNFINQIMWKESQNLQIAQNKLQILPIGCKKSGICQTIVKINENFVKNLSFCQLAAEKKNVKFNCSQNLHVFCSIGIRNF